MADRNILNRIRYSKWILRNGMELYVPPSDLVNVAQIPQEIDPWTVDDVTQQYPLGTKLVYGDKAFRYFLNGAVATIAGRLYQSVVPLAGHIDEVIGEPAIGDTTINFTPNTVTTDDMALNEFADGDFYVNDDTGEAYDHKIASHPAIVGGVLGVLTLRDPIVVVPGAAATGTIHHNPFRSVIIHPAPPTAPIVGCAISVVTAARFGWLQTAGPKSIVCEGTMLIGELVVAADGSVDGAIEPGDAIITDGTPPTGHGQRTLGYVMVVNATTEMTLVNLQLDHV